ncbi:glutamate synthase central domain-containing protein, partial [Guyparkeria sp. 1SP6A2]|nr:glutamate synthase central domain-containing protein [Guyparkeria sp. 1SP6A2]
EADNVHSQPSPERLLHRQQAFGVSSEEVNDIIFTLAETGYEPLGSMGADRRVGYLRKQLFKVVRSVLRLMRQHRHRPIG